MTTQKTLTMQVHVIGGDVAEIEQATRRLKKRKDVLEVVQNTSPNREKGEGDITVTYILK